MSAGGGGFRRGVVQLVFGGSVGKLSGLLREVLTAAAYGTSSVVGSFRIAQTSTLVPLNLVTGDALNSGFLPVYGRLRSTDPRAAAEFYAAFRAAVMAIAAVVAVALFLGAETVVGVVGPGLSAGAKETATLFVRVMALAVPLYLYGVVTSYLCLAHEHYRPTSLRATCQNSGMLAGVGVAWVSGQPAFLAWGFVAGCAAFCLYAATRVRSLRLIDDPGLLPGVRVTLHRLRPLALLLRGLLVLPLVTQAGEVGRRVVSSFLGDSVVAGAEFASFITDTLTVLVAAPIGLAGLAALSARAGTLRDVAEHLRGVLPPLVLIGVPISAFLALESRAVVRLVYSRGAFGEHAVDVTSAVLSGLAVFVWAQLLAYVVVKNHSAVMRVREIVWASVAGLAATLTVSTVALVTGNTVLLGVAGTVPGVAVLALLLPRLGLVSLLLRWLLVLLPGVVAQVVLSSFWQDGTPMAVVLRIAASLVVWAAVVLLQPAPRRVVIDVVRQVGRRG